MADHVIFSERGLQAYSGGSVEEGLRSALAGGARVAAVTRGENGTTWIESDSSRELRRLPAFAVEVVDTLAAGDVFHGAYALAMAEGRQIGEAIRFAAAAAAIKCSRPGGRKGTPLRAEVEAFLAGGY